MDANIAHTVWTFLVGTGSGGLLTYLTMWHKLREQKAKADKAVEELEEFRNKVRLDRAARQFTEVIPLYVADVELAFVAVRRSSPKQPKTITLTSLAKAVDVDQDTLRKVFDVMNEKVPGRVTMKASTFFHGETDVTLNS